MHARLPILALLFSLAMPARVHAETFHMIELTFHVSIVKGNPFDYLQNDIQVKIKTPTGRVDSVPAFFDGAATWRIRYAPRTPGNYVVIGCDRNGAKADASLALPQEINISGAIEPGFIHVDPKDRLRFAYDNGTPYFPLGNDAAWGGQNVDLIELLKEMGAAGENWSRIWMCHWDGKNLDWPATKEGVLNLEVARKWDAIVAAAQTAGIHFQMTLQHHGQYSTMVDPNWNDNPWNTKNGGFLASPEEFFTSERAKALTKAKYRYIIARYGYSPAIMAWELFNEVEGTDAGRKQKYAEIAAWHKEMAAFIRSQDPYHHLITTSSDLHIPGLFDSMDYLQPHSYSPDPMAAIAGIDPKEYGKPIFYGEMGPSSGGQSDPDFVRTILWASMMSSNSGAGQYWFWDQLKPQNLLPFYRSASAFLRLSGLEEVHGLSSGHPIVQTEEEGSFSFGPGGGWETAAKTTFKVSRDGSVTGAGGMPAYFQGKAHREMFPSLEFDVDYKVPGDFAVSVGTVARSGASLRLLVDGKPVAFHSFPAADKDTRVTETLHAPVPAGRHVVSLENNGADWVTLARFTLKPYGPALHALTLSNSEYAAGWIYSTDASARSLAGPTWLTLKGFDAGSYDITFWDPDRGIECGRGQAIPGTNGTIKIGVPIDGRSIAMFLKKRK